MMIAEQLTLTRKATLEDYFALPETEHPAELLDGEIEQMPPPEDPHQDTCTGLSWMFKDIIPLIPGAKLKQAPLSVILDENNIPEPNLFVVLPGSKCKKNAKGRWQGPPDLVIEVLSPSSIRRDRVKKFDLYERHGVKEYWIVDHELRNVEVWVLQNGVFELLGRFDSGTTFASPTLNNQPIDVLNIFLLLDEE